MKIVSDCYLQESSIVCGNISYKTDEFSLMGPHNLLNIMAVLLAIRPFTQGKELLIKKALTTFHALEHRMEFVDEIEGVKFVNDSKATNTDSVKYALQSYPDRVHLILGGSDKGEDFSTLLPYLQSNNVIVYLIGTTRPRMRTAFKGMIDFKEFDNLDLAVRAAYATAFSGDTILLSPACASYDAFKNFIHMGNSFKDIVRSIANE